MLKKHERKTKVCQIGTNYQWGTVAMRKVMAKQG